MRFGDIKYQTMVWHYLKKKSHLCRFKGACPFHFVPTSSEKDTTPNALLVKKFASQYIQPVANKDITCTIMMLENLAKPHWISVPCTEKIISDVACVEENQINGSKWGIDKWPVFNEEKPDIDVTSTIFQCNDGTVISSMWQCNGFMDCFDGEDERNCSCFVRLKPISDSYFCRHNCKKPECFCSELFFQAHTIGCFQYKSLVTAQSRKAENGEMKTELLFTCPNETLTLDKKFVNDLIPDCDLSADENILYLMLTTNYKYNMTNISKKYNSNVHKHCFDGHPKIYHVSKECIYKVDKNGILQTCRNGKHLQNCSDFNCQKYYKFKCPGYYCIPMGYVCDGKIDCPRGFDEINCKNLSCFGLFRCFSTSQCIFVADVCDGVQDCMNGDDEFNCEIHKSECPNQCVCLGFAVSCDYSFQNVFSIDEVVQNRTYASVVGNKLLSDFRCLQSCEMIQFLILSDFQIYDFCSSFTSFQQDFHEVISIVLSKNSIALLRKHCFPIESSILSLNFGCNMISVVEKFTFTGLANLKVLDLSRNRINVLNTKSFDGLQNMTFLKINQNPLQFIHIHLLQEFTEIKLIFSDNYRLCCIKPRSDIVCNSVIKWPASCKDLISKSAISLSMWVIMLLVIILNVVSIANCIKVVVKERNKMTSTFQIFAFCLNICDFACGIYLAIIISFSTYFKGSYAINELHWRSHFACYMASYLFTFFQLSSLSIVGFMTLARLLVVIDPFRSRFRIFSFTIKSVISVFISISFTSVLITGFIMYMSESNLLPNGLCTIFYDPMGQTLNRVSAIALSLLQLTSCFSVIFMYLIIYNRTRASFQEQTNGVDNFLQRKMIFQIVLITGSNIVCWVPSGIIYILSALTYKFPAEILLYTTIYITPVNSIVNPVFITLVNTIDNA